MEQRCCMAKEPVAESDKQSAKKVLAAKSPNKSGTPAAQRVSQLHQPWSDAQWQRFFEALRVVVGGETPLPSVSMIADEKYSPFRVLISTVISLRTKDAVTLESSLRLFSRADTPRAMVALTPEEIGELIYPAGFYKRKGEQIHKIATILLADHDGKVPKNLDALIALPGVGLKTANLTLSLGHNIPAICVDIHVHRICNRVGAVATKDPDHTEAALRASLPDQYWREINDSLVLYGQTVCTPVSPYCSTCPMAAWCPKVGVEKSR